MGRITIGPYQNWPLRRKLFVSQAQVVLACAGLSAGLGSLLIGKTIVLQAQEKVRLDLNTAHEIFRQEGEKLGVLARLTASRESVIRSLEQGDREALKRLLQRTMQAESLDVLNAITAAGLTLIRAGNSGEFGDSAYREAVDFSRSEGAIISTEVVPQKELLREGLALAKRSKIVLLPTDKARKRSDSVETSGMLIRAVQPVLSADGRFLGAIIAGRLLNNDNRIVDRVKEIVYQGQRHRGRDVGAVTIFLGDCRIATNVLTSEGARALGTRVSEEVYRRVVEHGGTWADRAFVVNAWYRAAYEPIRNYHGHVIGMIYAGMLEAPYLELRNRINLLFIAIAFAATVILLLTANYTSASITKPAKAMLVAIEKLASGDLSSRVESDTTDEFGRLSRAFNRMAVELERSTEVYQALARTLEEKIKEKTEELKEAQDLSLRTEKLAALGKLSAGIAHEINNPLTSILLNSHLLAEIRGSGEEELGLIIEEAERCSAIVRGLLEFSRQNPPERRFHDLNQVIEKTLPLIESQALAQCVSISVSLDQGLPRLKIDPGKIRQLLTNLLLNALDAMPDGGKLGVSTRFEEGLQLAALEVTDTGCGIPAQVIGRIFDPFFSTKGPKGTGMGLAVSYGIVEQHGGRIEVSSQPGRGTTFTVHLPVGDEIKSGGNTL